MSKKNENLLKESTVRRFMGLAGIGALTEKAVNKLSEQEELATEEELPPVEGEEMLPPDEELADEEFADEEMAPEEKDIDLSPEEAQVIVDLADRIKDEMPELEGEEGEDMLPPDEEFAGAEGGTEDEMMPDEELLPPEAMAESFMRTLQTRVQNRIQNEQAKARFINEVTQQVAANLRPRRGMSQEQLISEVMRRVALRLRQGR